MQVDYDKIYKYKTLALKLNQCHPDIKKDKKWGLMFTTMHGLFSTVFLTLVYNIFYINLKNDNFSKLCNNCVLGVAYLVFYNSLVLVRSQKFLKHLIETMKADVKFANSLNDEKREVVLKNALHGALINKIWFIVAVGAVIFYMLNNIIANIRSYLKGDFKLVPLFKFDYPEFIDADNLIVFIINYAILTLFLAYASIIYTSFVALGPCFILHAYGQLELLIIDIGNLFLEEEKDLKEKIIRIVLKQQEIYSFVDSINKIFRVAYDAILKSTVIATPISAYDVRFSLSHDGASVEFLMVSALFVSPMISSFICYYSELLIQQSERFRQAIYSCGWERSYDRRVRTSIILILQRALRPAAIQTVFGTICLVVLSEIFQQSYSLFNLMNVMWD